MAYTKRHRKHSSKRHRKYRHRGGMLGLNPATYSSTPSATATTTSSSTNNSIAPPYNAMAPDNSGIAGVFRTGAIDQNHINPNIIKSAVASRGLIEQEGGNNTPSSESTTSQQGGVNNPQQGGVWNKMIGDAIAPLVLLGLQQYYGPRRTKMNRRMNRGKMSRKSRR